MSAVAIPVDIAHQDGHRIATAVTARPYIWQCETSGRPAVDGKITASAADDCVVLPADDKATPPQVHIWKKK